MFGVGFTEILVILIVLFLFVGPKKSLDLAYQMGVWFKKLKNQFQDLKTKELSDWDSSPFYEAKTELNKSLAELKPPADDKLKP